MLLQNHVRKILIVRIFYLQILVMVYNDEKRNSRGYGYVEQI